MRNYVHKNMYKFNKPVVIPNKKKDAELHYENLQRLYYLQEDTDNDIVQSALDHFKEQFYNRYEQDE